LKGALAYPDIVAVVDEVLNRAETMNLSLSASSLEDALSLDGAGRRIATETLSRYRRGRQPEETI